MFLFNRTTAIVTCLPYISQLRHQLSHRTITVHTTNKLKIRMKLNVSFTIRIPLSSSCAVIGKQTAELTGAEHFRLVDRIFDGLLNRTAVNCVKDAELTEKGMR